MKLELDDFTRVGEKVPHLGDLKPFGRYVMNDVDKIGGIPVHSCRQKRPIYMSCDGCSAPRRRTPPYMLTGSRSRSDTFKIASVKPKVSVFAWIILLHL